MNISDKINKYIDEGLTKKNKEEKARKYLGASILGYPCGRKIQYMWKNTPRDAVRELSGKVLRIFKMGDKYEELAIEWLEQAGFKLVSCDDMSESWTKFTKDRIINYNQQKNRNGK